MAAFPERLDLYGQALARWLHERGPLRLIVRMPGNIGDALIWRGTADLFERHRIDAERIDHRQALDGPHPDTTLVIPGSGALTRLWHEWLPELIERAAAQYRQVVVLASDYDPDVPVVARALALPNVWAIARQPLSYAAIRPFGRAVLMPDPALWCRRFHLAAPASSPPVPPKSTRKSRCCWPCAPTAAPAWPICPCAPIHSATGISRGCPPISTPSSTPLTPPPTWSPTACTLRCRR